LSERPGKRDKSMSHIIAQHSRRIKDLADVGLKLITELAKSIETEQLTEFFTIGAGPSKGSLQLCYFGYTILFRIEMELAPKEEVIQFVEPGPLLAAYNLTNDAEPKEILLTGGKFDKSGNIECENGSYPLEEFAPVFLTQVFNAALEKGMKLRP
jgi:hypothetical protein